MNFLKLDEEKNLPLRVLATLVDESSYGFLSRVRSYFNGISLMLKNYTNRSQNYEYTILSKLKEKNQILNVTLILTHQ